MITRIIQLFCFGCKKTVNIELKKVKVDIGGGVHDYRCPYCGSAELGDMNYLVKIEKDYSI